MSKSERFRIKKSAYKLHGEEDTWEVYREYLGGSETLAYCIGKRYALVLLYVLENKKV